jgi:hypothetical protein
VFFYSQTPLIYRTNRYLYIKGDPEDGDCDPAVFQLALGDIGAAVDVVLDGLGDALGIL